MAGRLDRKVQIAKAMYYITEEREGLSSSKSVSEQILNLKLLNRNAYHIQLQQSKLAFITLFNVVIYLFVLTLIKWLT